MILLDTHALVWLTLNPGELSGTAQQRIDSSETIFVSAASFWELAVKVKRGRIDLGMPVLQFHTLCSESDKIEILETTATHWIAAADLAWEHRDPIDRLLVATAKITSLPLITCDQEIHKYHRESVW